jgi:hypothetical protein
MVSAIDKGQDMLKKCWLLILLVVSFSILTQGCGRQSTVCQTDPPNLPVEVRQSLTLSDDLTEPPYPVEIQIRNRSVMVDKIVHGFVCDDIWSGTVYVDCDVEVPEYEVVSDEEANFFLGCDLQIEEGTVVYVAFHNDEAYYKGCSCHTND